jgi:AmmeMemoRadiSam system protein A
VSTVSSVVESLSLMTNDHDRAWLLALAREAIVTYASARELVTSISEPIAEREGGAFVTLHKRGELRGCIGHLEVDQPLGRVVPRCAVAAASTDPRFPPVSLAEVPELEIEISLLGPLEPIAGPADIIVGMHGLVVEREWHRGLLLPQVATEWGWDAQTFLAQTCHKAGLPQDAWKHWAKMWRFEAEVFSEKQPPHAA